MTARNENDSTVLDENTTYQAESGEKQRVEQSEAEQPQAGQSEAEHLEVEGEAEANSLTDDALSDVAEENQLTRQLAELREQAEEYQGRLLRVQADFDNFRRRSRQEKEETAKYASAKMIEQLLPVMDNFERALSSSKENKDFDALAKGVEMIFRQFDQVLSQEGLVPIEVIGQPFNPEYHQAVMQVESEEHEEGTVIEELQKGYRLKDKVLRPAMVKVSS